MIETPILPMTVLRRLDCVLEPTKDAVLERASELKRESEELRHQALKSVVHRRCNRYDASKLRYMSARLARLARGPMFGLLLLFPVGATAQDPVAVPSLSGNASVGFAIGSLGYRLGTLEIAGEVDPGGRLSARLLVGSRPLMVCPSDDLHPDCGERGGFAALLGGVQFAPAWKTVEPYMGVQVGFSLYDGPVSVSSELLTVPQIGLRLRLGSLGGVYGDASYVLFGLPMWAGGFPIAGMGLYVSIPSLFEAW